METDLKLQVRSETVQVVDATGAKLNMKDPPAFLPLRVTAPPVTQGINTTASPQLQLTLAGLL